MSVSRVIEVSFGGGSIAYAKVDTAYFYNNGILFKPTDIDLPASYQVHWADSPDKATTLETIGTAEGAPIPDDLWNRSRVIYGWIYLHPTEDSGITAYEVRIYKNVRAGLPDGTEPTPAEQSTINQLIGALNSAVEQTGEDVESASQSAQSAENAKTAAESARDTAGEYANDAESSAASASTSASQASTSATASAQSASQSAQIKADVEGMVDDAQGYASASAQSASASANSASDAQGYANSASASAQSASTSASASLTYANTASSKATEASTSAQTASTKATEASQSAENALSYKTDAESAKTASQTAQGLAESARDTAVSAKTDAESARDDAETARDEAQSAVASISGALDDKAPVITDTASGAIASFTDGADDLPLKSLVVDINPVQDLHGQDSPYPAGAYNLIPYPYYSSAGTYDGITYIINSDGTVKASGTTTGGTNFYIAHYFSLKAGTYTLFCKMKSTGMRLLMRDVNGASFLATLNATSSTALRSSTFTIETDVTNINIYLNCGYADTVVDVDGWFQLETGDTASGVYHPYSNLCPISGWTEVNVNHSDADTTNPTIITINLGQTVYGGKLDVLSGELVIDRAMVDLGTLNWIYNTTDTIVHVPYFNGIVPDRKGGSFNFICSCYANTGGTRPSLVDKSCATYNSSNSTSICIADSAYTDATTFKTAMTGQTIVYELATPLEIQLDAHAINSLYGVNNIWADSGDTEVEYRADTKAYIAKKIAEALASLT